MNRNYIRLAWRHIIKHPFYTLINTLGLSLSLLFCLLIGAYIWEELNINKQLKNSDRQYILISHWKDPNAGVEICSFGPIAKQLKEQYPNLVHNYYRLDGISSNVSLGDKHFRESLQLGDSTLLNVYGFPLLYGDARTALKSPYSVVITETKALKYFGKVEVLGKNLEFQSNIGEKHNFRITGVLKNIPENLVNQYVAGDPDEMFISNACSSFFKRPEVENWGNNGFISFIELNKGIRPEDLRIPIQELMKHHTDEITRHKLTIEPIQLSGYYLKRLNGGAESRIYILTLLALFILMMAIVNYINITISRSSSRMREIGLRKVLGSKQEQLVVQFLLESILMVFFSILLSLIVYPIFKPIFEQIIGKLIPNLDSFPLIYLGIPFALAFIIGTLAGMYPALVLSSMKSLDSLKGKLKTIEQNQVFRKALLIFQFSLSIFTLIATYEVGQQVNYFFSKKLGYDKEYMVYSQVPRDWSKKGVQNLLHIRDELQKLPVVSSACLTYEIPNGNNSGTFSVYKLGEDNSKAIGFQSMIADENFINTYKIPLLSGNNFEGRGLDSGKVLLNEKAVQVLGYKTNQEALGKKFRILGDPTVFTIKGIIKNYVDNSMKVPISPILIFNVQFSGIYRYLSFKLNPKYPTTMALEAIQKNWSQLLSGSSFEYKFMDDVLAKTYASEISLKRASLIASVLTLVISILGVLSLVALNIQKKLKEISVRKVLGSSQTAIIHLFLREYLQLIFISGAIAFPLAYYTCYIWLNSYSFRISISPLPFFGSILMILCLTFLVISGLIRNSLRANIYKNLRTE